MELTQSCNIILIRYRNNNWMEADMIIFIYVVIEMEVHSSVIQADILFC